ncbi:unnamed protein product [Meloidogyne enterolobii]|uniref:Uncharacterized protein n=1 Tax=Meloidogyne enterolobii TaxID=390850 RepID=A0ACB0YKR0_MELEN
MAQKRPPSSFSRSCPSPHFPRLLYSCRQRKVGGGWQQNWRKMKWERGLWE